MIAGVNITPLKKIPDEKGTVMHMLKSTDPHFIGFGEIYFSTIYPGVVKGWHIHKKMTVNNAVIVGRVKLVLYDMRENSPTKGELMELFIGEDNYVLVQIPPGVASGWKAIGNERAIMANCGTIPHNPDEMIRIDPFDKNIPYKWDIKHG